MFSWARNIKYVLPTLLVFFVVYELWASRNFFETGLVKQTKRQIIPPTVRPSEVTDISIRPIRAAMVIFITQRLDVVNVIKTVSNYQAKFNDKYNYDWVIVTYRAVDPAIRQTLASLINAPARLKYINLKYQAEFLAYRPNTDKLRVRETRLKLRLPRTHRKLNNIQYRHATRFLLGHFYNLDTIWNDYDYYWKVPSDSRLSCNVDYDVFEYMRDNNVKYGWLLMDKDPEQMYPLLLEHVKKYVQDLNNNFLPEQDKTNNNFQFILHNDTVQGIARNEDPQWKFNGCSYNTDFEIVDVSFFRSKQYRHFFNYLDNINGIYYESWRESHIKTIATSLFLDSSSVKFFDDIAVSISSAGNCPAGIDSYLNYKCTCDPMQHGKEYIISRKYAAPFQLMKENACVKHWHKVLNKPTPETFKLDAGSEQFFEFLSPKQ